MRDNYDGSEYGQVTVGRGAAVHFGNVKDGITACGRRGYLLDAEGHEVTCKTCLKMEQTTHDGSRPLIRDEKPAAPALTGSQEAALRLVNENGGAATVKTIAQALTGNNRPDAVTSRRVQGVLRSLVQHGHLTVEHLNSLVIYRIPAPVQAAPAPVEPEPTQTFEVTYLAPRTGTQRVERVEATTVHAVPVEPRDAEVLLSIYLVTKESALLALTEAAAESRTKYLAKDLPKHPLARAGHYDAWRLASRREDLARLRARQMGATVDETYAATVAGCRSVDPNY